MCEHDERNLALQLAVQLPSDEASAMRVIELLGQVAREFVFGGGRRRDELGGKHQLGGTHELGGKHLALVGLDLVNGDRKLMR